MPSSNPKNDLLQLQLRQHIENDLGRELWLTVYGRKDGNLLHGLFYAAIIPNSAVEQVRNGSGWNLSVGAGVPGFTTYFKDGVTETTYHRFGDAAALEPVVLQRNYHGLKPDRLELAEEFRLFHNLYEDSTNGRFIKFDDRGEEEVIAEVTTESVRVKTKALRQFLAAKQAHLAVFFDFIAHSIDTLEDLGVTSGEADVRITTDEVTSSFLAHNDRDISGYSSFSRLYGKKLIKPLPVEQCGVWPYDQRDGQFADFIIGVDDNGTHVLHTCEEAVLDSPLGRASGAASYLTPVHFRREVLARYYDNPDKFTVDDGYIHCGDLWGLRIDNDHEERIVVLLGDLSALSYDEQLYWKSFNVTPDSLKMSGTAFRRGLMAEFADPTSADLVFKLKMTRFNEAWEKRHGWRLFMALHQDDIQCWKRLRLPLTDTLAEFDDMVLALTKVVVDSLNENEIITALGSRVENEKGIAKLERFLTAKGYSHVSRDIGFLKKLQGVRSSSAAHRKGRSYDRLKKELELEDASPVDAFRAFLGSASAMLDGLTAHFLSEE